jgi:hypothetical protein
VPFTGSTMVCGFTRTPNRRCSHAAQAPRISASPKVTG